MNGAEGGGHGGETGTGGEAGQGGSMVARPSAGRAAEEGLLTGLMGTVFCVAQLLSTPAWLVRQSPKHGL